MITYDHLVHDPTQSAKCNSINADVSAVLLTKVVACYFVRYVSSELDLWQQHNFESYKLT